jgi:hypothetical protein
MYEYHGVRHGGQRIQGVKLRELAIHCAAVVAHRFAANGERCRFRGSAASKVHAGS